MIRVLILIAVSGFVLCVATLTAALAIGGPDAIASVGWNMASSSHWHGHHWDWGDDGNDWADGRADGPATTRTLTWTGGDTLEIEVPADVQYTQAAGAGSVKVSGPERLVAHVVIENGHIRYDTRYARRRHGRLTIV